MNGAESLVATLVDQGVDLCFANPGTSEMHFLAALDNPSMRSVLCLYEGVATGAADGWYRMRRQPASTLLHLGPGLANGLSNIHNARRASSGMVNIIGEHATAHLKYDAPLKSDIEGLARPLCHWVRRTDTAKTLQRDAAKAVAAARAHPGQIATLILPGETSWGDAGELSSFDPEIAEPPCPATENVEQIAAILRSGEPCLIIAGGNTSYGEALGHLGRISAATGCRLATQFFTARIERGAGRVHLERIPYAVTAAVKFLSEFKHIITVETGEPIAFFSYPGMPSLLKRDDALVHHLVETGEDGTAALAMLVDALEAQNATALLQEPADKTVPQGALEPVNIARAITAALPEDAILVDESLTSGRETLGLTAGAARHDVIQNMGGSIGYGTPVATGAALACPERPVFCIVGDGSAMYTIQSLWTQAREGLNVTNIIFANNSYHILKTEYANMGFGEPGPQALAMMEIDNPEMDWVAMAKSMGVPGVSVVTAEDFCQSMIASAGEPGPSLIEVKM